MDETFPELSGRLAPTEETFPELSGMLAPTEETFPESKNKVYTLGGRFPYFL